MGSCMIHIGNLKCVKKGSVVSCAFGGDDAAAANDGGDDDRHCCNPATHAANRNATWPTIAAGALLGVLVQLWGHK